MIREKLKLPKEGKKLLLHSCCAPCSGEIMEAVAYSQIEYSIFFYNPNIHPEKEYLIRKEENIRFANKLGVEIIDWDYDTKLWYQKTNGMEFEPERGIRCTVCFDMRLEETAKYAYFNQFDTIATTLGISRWKNLKQVNESGERAVEKYPGINYWDYNWRKGGGSQRMIQISKRERFYMQEYCGCAYSLRDSNKLRQRQGKEKIIIGTKYYTTDDNQ